MKAMKPLREGVKLNCTIISDTHIDIKHPMPWLPNVRLCNALRDSEKSASRIDAFVVVGDVTSKGQQVNWDMAKECFRKYNPADKILLATGNHDMWNDDGFDAAFKAYCDNCTDICKTEYTSTYFTDTINGYHFIFLGTDSESGCEANISNEQIEWFKDEMAKAGESGKPIFVFCHQSLNQRHGLPHTCSSEYDPDRDPDDGGIGERSEEIEKILKQYDNVYYFSGHSHMGIAGENTLKAEGYASIEKEDNITLINLPSLSCGNHHGELRKMCTGFQLEVYDDSVVIRPREYHKRKWILSVPMKDGKPYYEEKIV